MPMDRVASIKKWVDPTTVSSVGLVTEARAEKSRDIPNAKSPIMDTKKKGRGTEGGGTLTGIPGGRFCQVDLVFVTIYSNFPYARPTHAPNERQSPE